MGGAGWRSGMDLLGETDSVLSEAQAADVDLLDAAVAGGSG